MNVPSCTLAVCLLLTASAWAEPGRTITAECQMVIVPARQAISLVADLSDETKRTTAWPRVLEMVAKGEATLAATLLARGEIGGTLKAESIEEVRYPTEFEPPQVPESFFDPTASPNEALTMELLKHWPAVGIRPTAFDTRATGQKMEVAVTETTRSSTVRCRFTVEDVRLKQFDKFDSGHLANGEKMMLEQPRFTSMKVESSGLMEMGRPELIGVHRLPGEEKVELMILTLRFASEKAP